MRAKHLESSRGHGVQRPASVRRMLGPPIPDGADGALLAAQNRILANLASGCTIPDLMSDVAEYVARFAPEVQTAIHLVDPDTARLTRGISRCVGRSILRHMERIPLDQAWPVGSSFASGSPWPQPDPDPSWCDAYLAIEGELEARCIRVVPATSTTGACLAIVTAFERETPPRATQPGESSPSVHDVAASLLAGGIERVRTIERLLLAQSWIDRSREPTLCVRRDGSFIYVNDAACTTFGYSHDEILALRAWELDANVTEDEFERIWDLAARRGSLKLHTEVRCGDDRRIPVEVGISHVAFRSEGYLCAVIHNLSELRDVEKRLEECEARYALASRGLNDGLWSWDLARNELHLSPRWCALVGLPPNEIQAPPEEWWRRVHPDDLEMLQSKLKSHLNGQSESFEAEHRIVHTDGRYLWMLSRGETLRDALGEPTRIAGSLTDITKQKLAEERLRHDALHDDLTGLPNRAMFMDHLGRTLQRARRTDTPFRFAVLFLDFDRFKRINDSLGHLVGDQLLIAIARRLSSCVRPADTVARLGGDEFSILLDSVADASGPTRIAERIHVALREPFRVSGLEVFITASIGIAIGSSAYERPEDLLRDADTAMYRAKAAGKARHEIFDDAMHAKAIEQLKLESELRLALKRQQFCLLYQPVMSLDDDRPVGLEALARWRHPSRGLLTPASFLQVADESGLIVDIGWWIFKDACRQLTSWQSEFPEAQSFAIHVNVSGKELFQPELPERIETILAETGLRPEHLVLDIPENVIMHKADASVTILGQLKSLGLRIHLDDFGTGYSSLGYLHRFQIDALKIDHSFIRHLSSGGENWKTVRAIVSLASNLGMDVIAEGVESAEQLDELRRLDCKSAQGSFFFEPLTPEAVENRLLLRGEQPRSSA